MSVAVFVMPLRTWLMGNFRTTWGAGDETASEPRRRRTEGDAELFRDQLVAHLSPMLGGAADWNESDPAEAAVAFSAHSFSLPFELARRWSYRLPLPALSTLEGPQLWLPLSFEGILGLQPPWNEDETLTIASLPAVRSELEQLQQALRAEESLEASDLRGAYQVGGRLLEVVARAADVRMPVIVEV